MVTVAPSFGMFYQVLLQTKLAFGCCETGTLTLRVIVCFCCQPGIPLRILEASSVFDHDMDVGLPTFRYFLLLLIYLQFLWKDIIGMESWSLSRAIKARWVRVAGRIQRHSDRIGVCGG